MFAARHVGTGDVRALWHGPDPSGPRTAGVRPPAERERQAALQWARAASAIAACVLIAGAIAVAAGHPVAAQPRDYLLGGAAALIGVRVVAYARASAVGWLFLAVALACALTVASGAVLGTGPLAAPAAWVNSWSWWLGYALLPLVLLVLLTAMTGRRHTVLLALAGVGASLSTTGFAVVAWPDPAAFWSSPQENGLQQYPVLVLVLVGAALLTLSVLGSAVGTAVRWRDLTGPARTSGWLLAGGLLLVVATVLETVGYPLVWTLGVAALPAAAVVAITRYGLYDIDLLVHRSLLYGTLATVLLAVYAAGALALSQLAPIQAAPAAAVAATLLARPVHDRVHRRVDRYVYGQRSAPLEVLSALTGSVGPADDATASVRSIAATAATALKLPWAAIVLENPAQHAAPASAGSGVADLEPGHAGRVVSHGVSRGLPRESFALSDRGQQIGVLVVEVRSPEERLTRADRDLLRLLAAQAGATVHAVQLSQDLQGSRERLVLAREEERRRLRRDLHDGLGPCLSGVRLQVAALRRGAAAPAAAMLESLTADLHRSAAELRTIIDDLRPPLLDHGLQQALEHHAQRLRGEELDLVVRCHGDLDGLVAAVEVAAYRITTEAMYNTVRHARATCCDVLVHATPTALEIAIDDDGVGPSGASRVLQAPESRGSRIGVGSMRERAEELGGTMSIAPRHPSGTSVRVRLPRTTPAPVPSIIPTLAAGQGR